MLAFQICVKKMQSDGQVDPLEYDFFLRGTTLAYHCASARLSPLCVPGGTVLDRSQRPENPCKGWLSEVGHLHVAAYHLVLTSVCLLFQVAWDNITELDKLKAFRGLASSFESNSGTFVRAHGTDSTSLTAFCWCR